jgi:plastocyanin
MRTLVLAAAVSVALSCSTPPDTAAATPPPVTHRVMMEAVAFTPASLTLKAGDRIVWVNKDPFPHTATAAGAFDSREMAPDASWTFHATTPGEIHYICVYHPTMKGTIVVK